jgi:hydroxymethylglutaryl-CoA lyase
MISETQLIECPRDAMQGLSNFIATDIKVAYLNKLLRLGFHTLDFGSFVSPKAIPQMADTAEVLTKLDLSDTNTKLLAIIANERGAKEALAFETIDYLGFPFSISETFQQRNTNKSCADAYELVLRLQDLCIANNRKLVVYLSMAFGNPYGDPWDINTVLAWADTFQRSQVSVISLADTVGTATPEAVETLFSQLIQNYPSVTWGAHLHSNPRTWHEKVAAAWKGGCRRFDGALKGYGGCPMATDELVGNIATENLNHFIHSQTNHWPILPEVLAEGLAMADTVFHKH